MRRQRTSRQFAKKSSEKIGIACVRDVPNLNISRIKGALPTGRAPFCTHTRPLPRRFCVFIATDVKHLRQSVPYGRTVSFFNHLCSGSVSRRRSIPCFGKLQSAALVHGKGSAETTGFCWRSLVTFCRYWQKVTRRRQERGCWEKVCRRRQKRKELPESRVPTTYHR